MSIDMSTVAKLADEALTVETQVAEARLKAEDAEVALEQAQERAVRVRRNVTQTLDYVVNESNRPSLVSTIHSGVEATCSYATEAELLAFVNKVRAQGGADVLDALLPSSPHQKDACLVANALNFGCSVVIAHGQIRGPRGIARWEMDFPFNMDRERAEAIARSVDCELVVERGAFCLLLPWHIGNAAHAFDKYHGWTVKYNKRIIERPVDDA